MDKNNISPSLLRKNLDYNLKLTFTKKKETKKIFSKISRKQYFLFIIKNIFDLKLMKIFLFTKEIW